MEGDAHRCRTDQLHRYAMAGLAALLMVVGAVVVGCRDQAPEQEAAGPAETVPELMQARGLSEDDVRAALKTYTPSGMQDEYVMFASGGQAGNLIVIGMPSMRILKYVGVFTPEPWQGYGYGDETTQLLGAAEPRGAGAVGGGPVDDGQAQDLLDGARRSGDKMTWGDMHHPALSETDGDYDGEYLFVNDKANPRVAVIDLEDVTTKQIVGSELVQSEHGSTFVTPNTDYVVQGAQYPTPLGGEFAPIEEYDERYRGAIIFWKFDREQGRIDEEASFAIELPPYMQDLADAGKLDSDGWIFLNSFNTERAFGGIQDGNPPLESGASQNDMDYLHLINWRAAEQVVEQGKTTTIADMRTISMQTAIDEGLLYFVPEPKSPHGVDVTPDGNEVVISGKLDTHATVYSFAKMMELIDAERFDGVDPYGVPILPFAESIRGQVEIGLGPLHTQYDGKGNAYTSVYIESTIAKWSLQDLEMIEKIPVHYNVGHLTVPGGDTVNPRGEYLVSMNKWSVDRFADVGPLLPQNFQLIDIDGDSMQMLYDMPIPLGEPHYAQIIEADRLEPEAIYPMGYNPMQGKVDDNAVEAGQERIERREDGVHVYMTAIRSHFNPDIIRVKQGDTVHLHLTNIEQAKDAIHGFTIGNHNLHTSLEPGKHVNITFEAHKPGVWPMYCTEFCSALHLEMAGYLLVEPAEDDEQAATP